MGHRSTSAERSGGRIASVAGRICSTRGMKSIFVVISWSSDHGAPRRARRGRVRARSAPRPPAAAPARAGQRRLGGLLSDATSMSSVLFSARSAFCAAESLDASTRPPRASPPPPPARRASAILASILARSAFADSCSPPHRPLAPRRGHRARDARVAALRPRGGVVTTASSLGFFCGDGMVAWNLTSDRSRGLRAARRRERWRSSSFKRAPLAHLASPPVPRARHVMN